MKTFGKKQLTSSRKANKPSLATDAVKKIIFREFQEK